jgi:hemoglobin
MSVYEEIGGGMAVSKAVDQFYRRVLRDGNLAPLFDGVELHRLAAHQRTFLAAALGGPEIYHGPAGTDAPLDLGVDTDAYDAVLGHLNATLSDFGVPAETLAAITAGAAPARAEVVTLRPRGSALQPPATIRLPELPTLASRGDRSLLAPADIAA